MCRPNSNLRHLRPKRIISLTQAVQALQPYSYALTRSSSNKALMHYADTTAQRGKVCTSNAFKYAKQRKTGQLEARHAHEQHAPPTADTHWGQSLKPPAFLLLLLCIKHHHKLQQHFCCKTSLCHHHQTSHACLTGAPI
jgi:hypothetical protein